MYGLRCGAVIVDHQMQDGSGDVARKAATTAQSLGLAPVEVRVANVSAAQVHRVGSEAAAREARYTQLCAAAAEVGAAAVLVAHTRDDQVETVLLGMVRGSSSSAVAGMPRTFRRQGITFLRPLLDLTRDDTTAICEQNGISWWDDPTNSPADASSDAPLRSKIRSFVVPELERVVGPAIKDHIALIAHSVREDQELLEEMAQKALTEVTLTEEAEIERQGEDASHECVALRLGAQRLAGVPRPVRLRVMRIAVERCGAQATRALLERIDALVTDWHGQSAVRISSRLSVRRQGHVIELCQDRTHANS
jgi:tRNA(Ile)-lysidine synthase